MKKQLALRLVIIAASVIAPLYLTELWIAYEQLKKLNQYARQFEVTNTREQEARETGLELSYNGRTLPFLGVDIPKGAFPISAPRATSLIGYKEEAGQERYPVHKTDQYGFFNSPDAWQDPNLLIVGDSFATCEHLYGENFLNTLLKVYGYRPVNIGLTGSGPLFQLCALKAYWPKVSNTVERVVWLFCEWNDYSDTLLDSNIEAYLQALERDDIKDNPKLLELMPANPDGAFTPWRNTKSFLSLSRLRRNLHEQAMLNSESPIISQVLQEAQRFTGVPVCLVRLTSVDKQLDAKWATIDFANKIQMPRDPALYAVFHYNRKGYFTLVQHIHSHALNH